MNIILLSMNFIMWTCRSSVGGYWHDFPFHIILCSLIAVRLFQHCYFSRWILLVTVKSIFEYATHVIVLLQTLFLDLTSACTLY